MSARRPIEVIGHRIADLSYQENRLDCTCGATMTANEQDWRDHRRDLGLKVVTVGQSIGRRTKARV